MAPREVAWQIKETPSKAAGTVLRLLRLLRGAGKVPDGSFKAPIETGCGAGKCQKAASKPNRNRSCGAAGGRMAKQRNAVESCREGFEAFKAFKGCWKRARWLFQSLIETGCGASEVPDSSFKGQQKQLVAPWEVACQSSETPSKPARRVLRVLSV